MTLPANQMALLSHSFLSPNNMFIYVLNLTETTSHVIDFRCARSDTDLERSSGISHTPSWQMSRFWTKKYRDVRVPPAYLLGPTVPMTGHMFQVIRLSSFHSYSSISHLKEHVESSVMSLSLIQTRQGNI
ncbi:hypothetical protein BDB01DRAFT_839876 [Pilobolus umbonatus]|nr:hypothetical protein BDB01DRAFT_839876 [Pilobolus umbonatus]